MLTNMVLDMNTNIVEYDYFRNCNSFQPYLEGQYELPTSGMRYVFSDISNLMKTLIMESMESR